MFYVYHNRKYVPYISLENYYYPLMYYRDFIDPDTQIFTKHRMDMVKITKESMLSKCQEHINSIYGVNHFRQYYRVNFSEYLDQQNLFISNDKFRYRLGYNKIEGPFRLCIENQDIFDVITRV